MKKRVVVVVVVGFAVERRQGAKETTRPELVGRGKPASHQIT